MHAATKQQRTAHVVRILGSLGQRGKRRRLPRKIWPSAIERAYAAELRAYTTRAVAPGLIEILDALPPLVASARIASRVDVALDAERRDRIAHEGEKWIVYSLAGKRLGEYDSEADALARLRQIEHYKTDAGEVKAIVDRAYAQMMSRLSVRDIATIASRNAQGVSAHNRRQLGRQVKAALGVDVPVADARAPRTIDAFIDQNVSLVIDNVERLVGSVEKDITRILASSRIDRIDARQSSLARANVALIQLRPEEFDAAQLAAAIQRNVALGGSNAQLANEIQERFGFARDHAEFIARDQVGKLNGQLDAQRQQSLGITRFIWRTVGDERVREEHEARDGNVYEYDDPPDGELPGEPINCRCSAEPVFDDILEGI